MYLAIHELMVNAQRDWCAFIVCELCQKHSVLYYNVYLFWFIKIPTLKSFVI